MKTEERKLVELDPKNIGEMEELLKEWKPVSRPEILECEDPPYLMNEDSEHHIIKAIEKKYKDVDGFMRGMHSLSYNRRTNAQLLHIPVQYYKRIENSSK